MAFLKPKHLEANHDSAEAVVRDRINGAPLRVRMKRVNKWREIFSQ
jgi:hypothetical protein